MMRLAIALLSLALFVTPRTGEAQSEKIPLETAKALGLAIPQSVLVRADQLIQCKRRCPRNFSLTTGCTR